jgi:hypothetical protein
MGKPPSVSLEMRLDAIGAIAEILLVLIDGIDR